MTHFSDTVYPARNLACECGYDGINGWLVWTIDQDEHGNDIDGWFCPECERQVCTEGDDCPPDEFGQ